jgi:ribosomal 30S subunit maturation factor RimM
MGKRITVEFKKSHSANRGPAIVGIKGEVKSLPMTDALQTLIDAEVVAIVKKKPANKRQKATGKKGAEKS